MNAKAEKLNLTHTHFVTPHGLDDENHYTTAYELALITDYALQNEIFKTIVNTKIATISINGYPRTISNTNELLGNFSGVYGVKTGFTFEAGRCLVSSCNRNGMDIIVVVLGADTKNQRTKDSINIINYIYDNFEYIDTSNFVHQIFDNFKENYKKHVNLYKTTTQPEIKISELENYNFPLKANSIQSLDTKIYMLDTLTAKIQKNSKIGCIHVYYENKILYSIDIILENQLKQNNWIYYFNKILKEFNYNFYNKADINNYQII